MKLFLVMEKNLCDGCDSCCRHIAVKIDKPESKKEFDQIRWFLLHEDVWVFIDNDDSWNLQVNNRCEKLKDDTMCGYYNERPQICLDYSSENCERNGDGDSFKVMFKSLEDFESRVEKKHL